MSNSAKNYDSEFCGSLPLHNINLIQPYGCLIVLRKPDLHIIQASENISDLLGKPVEESIGTDFTQYITEKQSKSLQEDFNSDGKIDRAPFALLVKTATREINCVAIIHSKPGYLILEIEEMEESSSFIHIYQEVRFAMAAIEAAKSVKEACEAAAKELKKLSGFNKVMIYRFDENWNGTVIAEDSDEGLTSYMGLTFPASDIPKQARELYLKNAYRLIPSREYTPVRLYPVRNSVTNSFLDLSDCNLRAVPAVHLEYLKNMDVMCSMSTRIIIEGRLWGLISCHHTTAKNLSYEECSMFELLSNVISAKISSILHKEKFDFLNDLREKRTKLIDQTYAEKSLLSGLLKHPVNAMNLFDAGGVALVQNGTISSIGVVPGKEEIKNLVMWLQNKEVAKVYAEESLASQYHYASEFTEQASGLLAIAMDKEKGNYLLAFRPEIVTTVNWGGNPDEAINFEPDGKKYHPRNSFRLWQEKVINTSAKWQSDELQIADELRSFIYEYSSKFLSN